MLSAKSLTLVFVSSLGLGERGHTRETTTDRRERREWRRGPRDAQAEEPSALLSLPNQTRAGAAGTGILSLWSVSSLRRMSLYKQRWSSSLNAVFWFACLSPPPHWLGSPNDVFYCINKHCKLNRGGWIMTEFGLWHFCQMFAYK